jgi:hypothetical protein
LSGTLEDIDDDYAAAATWAWRARILPQAAHGHVFERPQVQRTDGRVDRLLGDRIFLSS